ncbi:hypothetical protein L9F63_018204, partial [Diploptera punctata]
IEVMFGTLICGTNGVLSVNHTTTELGKVKRSLGTIALFTCVGVLRLLIRNSTVELMRRPKLTFNLKYSTATVSRRRRKCKVYVCVCYMSKGNSRTLRGTAPILKSFLALSSLFTLPFTLLSWSHRYIFLTWTCSCADVYDARPRLLRRRRFLHDAYPIIYTLSIEVTIRLINTLVKLKVLTKITISIYKYIYFLYSAYINMSFILMNDGNSRKIHPNKFVL